MQLPYLNYFGVIIFVLNIIVSTGLAYSLFTKYNNTKIKPVLILSIFYLVDLLAALAEFPFFLLNFNQLSSFYVSSTPNIFLDIFIVLGMLSGGIFLFFVDFYKFDKIKLYNLIIFSSSISAYFMFIIMRHFSDASNLFLFGPISLEMIPGFFLTYVGISVIISIFGIKKNVKDHARNSQLNYLILTIFCYYIVTTLLITTSANIKSFIDPDVIVLIQNLLPRMFVVIGHVILLLTYARSRNSFLQLINLDKLIVILPSGIPLFSYDFSQKSAFEGENDLLLSGGLSAISSLLSESINVSNLKTIEFQEKQIMISHTAEQKEKFGVFLIVEKPTIFLWNGLNSFKNTFHYNFGDKLANNSTDVFLSAVHDVESIFGL